ncbi:hypothetical protein KDX16_33645 [Burkholderia vietnamiensis]|jgi:hypothetical protein|uniref:Uncharacterized protein n=2 Tax=Burkholderia cepacia complex TaxID=87882 RepID=A0A228HI40_9BURK|nr:MULTISPECIES: hypothetical protein [Burkholderia]HDR9758759.1 hypothetical protein [Burkholderia cepacia ATCC 25416]MBR7920747.1 hypothetical protein [Burkholderia vietnamiensis]MBR8054828.1 hypothetical protein [Burkholderia vietnamiensis]MDN7570098.1 hypothetical protein [Burkholderia contaminans]OXI29622.1 hypothetical protein CFB84_43540 [Burkholderia aenigmatica]
MRDRNGQTTENLIRIPTEVARVVLGHASADVRNELKTCWENRDLYRREDGLVPVDALYGMLDRGRLADQVRARRRQKSRTQKFDPALKKASVRRLASDRGKLLDA